MLPLSDHTPNPEVVARYAEQHGYAIDTVAWELMVGRWTLDTAQVH